MKKKYSNGVYEGEGTLFTKKRHGKGTMTYSNGSIYEGEWKDDQRCGIGELRKSSVANSSSYKGEWRDDKLNGQGTFNDNYTSYEGEFKDGEYNGNGTLSQKRYNVIVSTYTGNFVRGKKHGQGTEKCKEYTYKGSFINDKMNGQGRQDFPNKDYFDGSFLSGVFHKGKVRKTEETGDVYVGCYEKNAYEGHGKLTMTDGTVYTGNFKGGQLHGVITVTKPDGTKVKETYENGVAVAGAEAAVQEEKPTAKSTKKSTETKNGKITSQEKKATSKKAKSTEETSKNNTKAAQDKRSASKAANEADEARNTQKKPSKKAAPEAKEEPSDGRTTKTTTKKASQTRNTSTFFKKEISELNRNINNVNKLVKESVKRATEAKKDAEDLAIKIRLKYAGRLGTDITNKTTNKTDKYYGDFSFDNKVDGWGIYEWADGEKYVGEHCFGYRSGLGVYEYSDGNKYMGKWWDDKKHGSGVFAYSKGGEYIGDFVTGNFEGYGRETSSSGGVYEGEFKNDKSNGYGTYIWSKDSNWTGDKYIGQWKDNEKSGFGIYYYSNGDKYVGDWIDSQRTGNGIYYFQDGERYEGGFLDGKYHGDGTLFLTNGDRVNCKYENDVIVGSCLYIHADGTEEIAHVVNGKVVFDQKKDQGTDTDNDSDQGKPNTTNDTSNQSSNNNSADTSDKNNEKGPKDNEKKMFTPVTGGGITFDDVAGLSEVKDEIINHVIEPLRNPELASIFGVKPGGKILLYGPPGTGKTYIARAIAGEIDAAFYSVSCQDLISKWLGESSERISKLFDEAQEHDKAIIFFDEFDSVAAKRDSEFDSPAMARFLATFLTKVDGFKPIENKMLLLIAATNRPWALDSAILRGGRFDKQIYISLPDKEAREFLVNKALGTLPLDEGLSLSTLADSLEGFGGSDIVSICEKIRFEAYKKSIKSKQIEKITAQDCENAMKGVQNHISKKELERFESYKNGLNNQ